MEEVHRPSPWHLPWHLPWLHSIDLTPRPVEWDLDGKSESERSRPEEQLVAPPCMSWVTEDMPRCPSVTSQRAAACAILSRGGPAVTWRGLSWCPLVSRVAVAGE